MEESSRRRTLGSPDGPPSVILCSLHTEQNAKPAPWHRVHRGYQKVIQRWRRDTHVQCVC